MSFKVGERVRVQYNGTVTDKPIIDNGTFFEYNLGDNKYHCGVKLDNGIIIDGDKFNNNYEVISIDTSLLNECIRDAAVAFLTRLEDMCVMQDQKKGDSCADCPFKDTICRYLDDNEPNEMDAIIEAIKRGLAASGLPASALQ